MNPSPDPLSCCREDLQARLRPELFRALCDPTRLQLLARLALGRPDQTVTEVSDCCGVHLSGVSRHLAILREAGVVAAAKQGRKVRYSLEREALTAALRGLADAIDAASAIRGDESIEEETNLRTADEPR